jgi:Arc/MetJ family transcription regulator
MKRTNLVLPEDLVDEAMRLSGAKTYSSLVETALRELVRRIKARQIFALKGSGAWHGDIGEMRGDRPTGKQKRRRRA